MPINCDTMISRLVLRFTPVLQSVYLYFAVSPGSDIIIGPVRNLLDRPRCRTDFHAVFLYYSPVNNPNPFQTVLARPGTLRDNISAAYTAFFHFFKPPTQSNAVPTLILR